MKKFFFYKTLYLSLIALAAAMLLGLTRCGNASANQQQADSEASDEHIPVRTAPVERRALALPVQASGILTSSAEQRLSFKIGGVLRKIYVKEGDVVRAGQLLAVLDKTEIDAQVAQAQQALAKAERDLARVEGLYRDSSATLELLQNATTARDVAREAERIARFNQQYAEIRATRPGKIIRKLMNEGEIVGPGTPVFVLFETGADDWVVKVSLSDRDWARLSLGANARVTLDAYPETPFAGKVSDLAPAADPASGLYTVEVKVIPQTGKRFAPGLFAQVSIAPPAAKTFAVVPIEAIVEGEGLSAYVFVLQPDGKRVRKVPVRVAFLEERYAVVASGLEGVSEVITAGAPYLNENKTVKKVND
jgi:RND family efflux transporter MFP subunit